MEEAQDESKISEMEMGSRIASSWVAVEGRVEDSVKVVEESEDAMYTAGATGKLVLAPAPSELGESVPPCELTVTFEQRLGHIHQIYVLSTARICEIYGQKVQDGDLEYVCTVRGGIINLTEEDLPDNATTPSAPGVLCSGDIPNAVSLVPLAVAELDSKIQLQRPFTPSEGYSEELVSQGKKDFSLPPSYESPSSTSKGSEEELFRSFTGPASGRIVDGRLPFEESLDHADWVECPHSPMKSSATSDDDAELENSKSGFYIIDADHETQHSEHPQVRLFTDAIGDPGKNDSGPSLVGDENVSSINSSWLDGNQDKSTLQKSMDDSLTPHDAANEPIFWQGQKVEEPSDSPRAQLHPVMNDAIRENLPKTGLGTFEVNGEHASNDSATSSLASGNLIAEIQDVHIEDPESMKVEHSVEMDQESRGQCFVEPPVYECEVNLVDADAWASLTIRLLSMKNKAQVQIHRVVVTFMPGPPIQPWLPSPRAPFQPGGSSSLLAMLVPGILQMARGLSEPRRVNNLAVLSAGTLIGVASEHTTKLGSQNPERPNAEEASHDHGISDTLNCVPAHVVDKNLNLSAEEEASCVSCCASGDSRGTPTMHSIADQLTQSSTEYEQVLSKERLSKAVLPQVVDKNETRNVESVEEKETGPAKSWQNEFCKAGELVERLDRLEMICLRIESSLNSALENMDKRLKLLESGGGERASPTLGHMWGPGFDSSSFVSATSVHPAAHTGVEMYSMMNSSVDIPSEEASGKLASSAATPVYPALQSPSSPSLLSSGSSALPLWTCPWPKQTSADSSLHSSGLSSSLICKSGQVTLTAGESVHDSDHPSNGGETYWESRSSDDSDDSEVDIISDSELPSYAGDCEDSGCQCCPEPRPSSPAKPVQLVDNALASALSAFSASFGAKNVDVHKQDEEYHDGEDIDVDNVLASALSALSVSFGAKNVDVYKQNEGYHDGEDIDEEEDSFTSEEQVPLVDLDCLSLHGEKEEARQLNTEEVFNHDYEALPVSSDKGMVDLDTGTVIKEDTFWTSQNVEKQQMTWQDQVLPTQEERIPLVLGDLVHKEEGGSTPAPPAVVIQTSSKLGVDDATAFDIFRPNIEIGPQRNLVAEALKNDFCDDEAFEAHGQDLQQNPFMWGRASAMDGSVGDPKSAWLEEGWSGKQEKPVQNLPSSYVTIRGFSEPLVLLEEALMQQDGFPEEWNWFASEFSPFSSLVDVRYIADDGPTEEGPLTSLLESTDKLKESFQRVANDKVEPWSLLDEDASASTTQRFDRDIYGKDWLSRKGQWSLLDGYMAPPFSPETHHPEENCLDERLGHKELRSLLDEDISIPPGDLPVVEQEVNPDMSSEFFVESLNLSGMIRSSNYSETSHSPSSQASKSNPFEDEYDESIERLDLSQEGKDTPLVSLEDVGEDANELETINPERTPSLLFHLSL